MDNYDNQQNQQYGNSQQQYGYTGQQYGNNGSQYNYSGMQYGNNGNQLEQPLTLGEWVVTLLILAIPCVNIVMLFVWGFGQGNTSRKNYCRASLIFAGIGILFCILFGAAIIAGLSEFAYSTYY